MSYLVKIKVRMSPGQQKKWREELSQIRGQIMKMEPSLELKCKLIG